MRLDPNLIAVQDLVLPPEKAGSRAKVVRNIIAHPKPNEDMQHDEHPLARFVEIDAAPKAPVWLVPGFIARGLVMIAGAWGVGKTTALLPLAMTVAGLHRQGDPLTPKAWRHVVYVVEDVDQAQRIVAGIVNFGGLGLNLTTVKERLHLVEARRLSAAYVAGVGTTYREMFTRVERSVEVPPLVVFDTKSAVIAVESENDNSEASAVMATLKQDFADLPIWLVGHITKADFSRGDVGGISARGAGAYEADSTQTMYLVKEKDARFLVQGKKRFEPWWPELHVSGRFQEIEARDEFGDTELMTLRWAIAEPPQVSRRETHEQAQEQARRDAEAELRAEVMDVIQSAWQAGHPLNREGVKAKVRRKTKVVADCVTNLLTEQWLVEVEVPAKERTNANRARFLVKLSTAEHDEVMSGRPIPAIKLEVPSSWKKAPIPSVPEQEPENEPEVEDAAAE